MGDGVNIAARLEGIARPGAICLSEDAYRQVKSRLDLNVSDLGATVLKNIAEPVRVYSRRGRRAHRAGESRARAAKPTRPGCRRACGAARCSGGRGGMVFDGGQTRGGRCVARPWPRSGPPTVAILPFANTTGNAQYDALAQRIGQKTTDAASNATIWRIIGRSGGAAGNATDPIDAGRQLNADYVVAGNVEAAGDALRVAFQVDDVHSGARVWSRTVSPMLESAGDPAAEGEVAGHAVALLSEAILETERARLSSAGDITKTTWGCILQGFAGKPDRVASARECLEAAAQKEPSNPNVWESLAQVLEDQRVWGWGLRPEEASVDKRVHLADRELQASLRAQDLAPLDGRAQYYVAMGYFAACQADRVRIEAEKAAALNPYNAGMLGTYRALGCVH